MVVGDNVTISIDSPFVSDMSGVVTEADDTHLQVTLVGGEYDGYIETITKVIT